ncbi:HlyD family secretion protein [Salegentibacter mishustinae]|jgi:multidrug resistance efflux pump|uniref:Biotin attachment protein n=1 Tax=Salegentibacter mishustinae TaxID=270918 RepID=A0A0Q9ZBS6_9FLAO|nr:HlyD family efflux transporter periplasmic adaptor subunit [Salegentibacter mishustinae]KRG30509.1 biotin attachment protein [Salegentibacter mishustinae]PNW23400.1 biotin attachment protein [Salegentibacter mishustinae]PZX66467.1 multidrug resistance efflux pump [Salegentibacter mishustinae]GGW82716.1 biotin attachment protein [Salegentibacter mishustinae]
MLNISEEKLNERIDITDSASGKLVFFRKHYAIFNKVLIGLFVLFLIILFLPWTQNIRSTGNVTTLSPEHRPQTIQSPIPGRIEQWYISEGDFVNKGDTILRISEVSSDYFDPQLISRTSGQIDAKNQSALTYDEKINALRQQLEAQENERELKLSQAINKIEQARLKVRSDSIKLEAAQTQVEIAKSQFERLQTLQEEGLYSQTDLEARRLKLQEAQAKLIAQRNDLLSSRNQVINAEIEINRIRAEYADKISKTKQEIFTSQGNQFTTQAEVDKLEIELSNYEQRSELYYIVAPQDGYVNKALRAGLGETFSQGEQLVGIMPSNYQMAVETYVRPLDLPLIHVGEKVQIQFDGWPAIIFSGWPNLSYGTYGAKVVAVENYISPNGKYRVLLAPDPDDNPWPEQIGIGSGAQTIALLENVPIWYELWRNLNGFPPNYYSPNNGTQEKPTKSNSK